MQLNFAILISIKINFMTCRIFCVYLILIYDGHCLINLINELLLLPCLINNIKHYKILTREQINTVLKSHCSNSSGTLFVG